MCAGMSCFGRVWWGFVGGLFLFERIDISGNFDESECKFSNVTRRFSAPLLGLRFNEVSGDEGNRTVVLQNAQGCGDDPVSEPGEPPPLPQNPQKCRHRLRLINKTRFKPCLRYIPLPAIRRT